MNVTIVITDGKIKSIIGEENLSEVRKLLLLRTVVDKEIYDLEKRREIKESTKQTNIIDVINEVEKDNKQDVSK
jgi:hypothetical protein